MENIRLERLYKELDKLERICFICIDLLDFKITPDMKRSSLKNAVKQVVREENYNKIKTIERISDKANEAYLSNDYIKKIIKEKVGDRELADEIYHKYFLRIHELKDIQNLLKDTANKIKLTQDQIKYEEERIKEKEELKRQRELDERKREEERIKREEESSYSPYSSTYTPPVSTTVEKPITTNTSEITKETIREEKEVKKRLSYESLLYDEDYEKLAKEYNITDIKYSSNFISKSTIEKIISVYDAQVGLSKKYKMNPSKLANGFNSIYELAVEEAVLGDASLDGKMDKMRNLMNSYGGYDFVERYYQMYNDIEKYINSLPNNERNQFQDVFIDSLNPDLKQGKSLITPEQFRNKVNEKITKEILHEAYINSDNLNNLTKQTKYMDADDIVNIYREINSRNPYTSHESVKDACVKLILLRMPKVDSKDPNYSKIIEERIDSILIDYFHESKIGSKVEEGHAKELVGQKELVEEKKKEYFRMSKFKRALATMSFKKLMKLSEKKELTDKEENELRRMF